MLSTYTPFLISFFIGYLLIFCLQSDQRRIPLGLQIFLAIGIGLGISSQLTFWNFMLFKKYTASFILTTNLVVLASLVGWATWKVRGRIWCWFAIKDFHWWQPIPYLVLLAGSYPLWKHGHFYVYGGWDAWATWNLKAKILFLSDNGWTTIFDPVLWRSSPHYPLHLPLINCWGWIFKDSADFAIPVTTAFIFSFATIGVLFAAIARATRSPFAILSGIVLLTSTMYIKLSLSQYADIVVAYYLLAAIVCLVLAKIENNATYATLGGLCLGFLSFSKGEGLIAAGIIGLLAIPFFFYKHRPNREALINLFVAAVSAGIVTVIFTFFVSPKSTTFINGLFSQTDPVTYFRVKAIFSFMLVELVSPTWNGLWILLVAGMLIGADKCFRRNLILIPTFLLGYIAIISVYYFVNTYFDNTRILWWLQVSLHRLMYATLPSVIFWVFVGLWYPKRIKTPTT